MPSTRRSYLLKASPLLCCGKSFIANIPRIREVFPNWGVSIPLFCRQGVSYLIPRFPHCFVPRAFAVPSRISRIFRHIFLRICSFHPAYLTGRGHRIVRSYPRKLKPSRVLPLLHCVSATREFHFPFNRGSTAMVLVKRTEPVGAVDVPIFSHSREGVWTDTAH